MMGPGDTLHSQGAGMNPDNARPMTGRTVVVTGGSSGIGKATAERLAQLGATVVITGRDPARTHDAARQIRTSTGTSVQALTADLSDQAQVRQLAAEPARGPAPDRRAGEQRRRVLEHPAHHR